MHGAGEQQRYRYARNDEHQPSTSSQGHQMHPMQSPQQITLMHNPTTSTASNPLTVTPSGAPIAAPIVRFGQPIKIGDNILQPAGTLVFSQGDNASWSSGHRVLVHHANKHSVVQANLFPIGSPALVPTGNWYINQQPVTTSSNNSVVPNRNPATASSATPDSGIQSVPTSPPSPSYQLLNERDEEEDEDDNDDGPADFTDMPTLKPAHEDDSYDGPLTSVGPSSFSETPTTTTPVPSTSTVAAKDDLNGMNAEEFLAVSIARNMDLDEIVKRLIALDPDKASSIATLIKEKADAAKKKKDMEAEVSSTTPSTPRARVTRKTTKMTTRSTNSPDVTTSTEEPSTSSTGMLDDSETKRQGKRRGRRPKKRENLEMIEDTPLHEEVVKRVKTERVKFSPEPTSSRPQSSTAVTVTLDPVQYRLKVREMMERQLEQQTQKMSVDMSEMRVSHSTTNKTIAGGKRKESFFRQLNEQSKRIKKGQFGKRLKMFMTEEELRRKDDEKPKETKEKEEDVLKMRGRLPSRRSRVDDSPEVAFTVEEKYNGEYYEISKSVPSSDDVIPLWRAPSLTCGCTKGACTSDMDCLNRAMRVQCSSDCTLSYCSNRRFWKEDSNKLCVSHGQKTRKLLRTKVARRAGEFLCEYAGEVIKSEDAQKRFEDDENARIIAIGSQLFIDATVRGNVCRFVKHSCKPNSRLEVWSVNGYYRAGVFALIDLMPNVEITIDKSGLLPFARSCTCGSWECKKVIRGVRSTAIAVADEKEHINTSRFLTRSRRHTIERARQHSGLPAILTTEVPAEALPSPRLQMKKVLAAFSFRVRRIDGSLSRSMLPYYTAICKFLKCSDDNASPDQFISLCRKWLDAIDDDDLERAFVAIESHYMSSSILSSAQSKKARENAPRPRAQSTCCQSPVPPKRGDADLSYLESSWPIGSYNPDDAWDEYHANASDDAVRCICGALDEDGEMVQCDECHFWLHIDCTSHDLSSKNEDKKKSEKDEKEDEYRCDFCLGKQDGNRPSADVKLRSRLDVRFEHCDYYRSLVNRRGIQVRLNETVFVNRVISEDHKAMLRHLREEKKGIKSTSRLDQLNFPKAPTSPLPHEEFDRREARIFRVERLFVCPGNNRFVFGSYYAWPHETYAETSRLFSKKEVFATNFYDTLPLDEVFGRCLVIDTRTWCTGRPKVPKFKEDDIYLCEMQIGKNKRVFEKVPAKNRYPINMQPYVFTEFPQRKEVVRDFRPYDPSNPSPKPPKSHHHQHPSDPRSEALPKVDSKRMSRKNIDRVLHLLSASSNKGQL
ncbi:unnamed protein product [Caenorhabditis sp. 36 PRJEB53466]|nr:unnamed protein product [Caenorhabditis sp. 36 PRJEB53466]